MSWMVDHTSWFYVPLVCAALGLLACWWTSRKRQFLVGLGIVAGLAAFFWLLTLLVDSDRKRITRALQDMVAGVKERNLDKTFSHIAKDCTTKFANGSFSREELREQANAAVQGGGVEEIRIWDFDFEKVEGAQAIVTFTAKPFGRWATHNEFCGCRAEFRLDPDGRWRMHQLQLLNPGSTELLPWPR